MMTNNIKPAKKNINGILLLDKPLEMTSNHALQKVKRLFSAMKAGHTGSLDPLATGMLPICFGEATKFSQFLLDSDKQYEVTARLGIKTTTGDAEGEILSTRPVENITMPRLNAILETFFGEIQQIPPMYSAVKFQGKPLYELARKGVEIERKPRPVTIYQLECTDMQTEEISLLIHCSKGTYVRTLVEDIGELLGCGAHVSYLHRTHVSPYQDTPMYTLEALETLQREQGHEVLKNLLLPIASSVDTLRSVHLSTSAAFYLRTGQPVMVPRTPGEGLVRLYANDEFIGVGEILPDGLVAPRRLVCK